MKTAATFPTHDLALRGLAAMNLRQIYGTITGTRTRGYELLVNEKDLGTANELLTAWPIPPEVTK
jgi:hypothetical protein